MTSCPKTRFTFVGAALALGELVGLVALGCAQGEPPRPKPPSEVYGELFAAVQSRHLFADSKTFADASPRASVETIKNAWTNTHPASDDDLRQFIDRWFIVPADTSRPIPSSARPPLAEHIVMLWPGLTRESPKGTEQGSALPLSKRFVVPGGRFREMYYWDSYFTMLGLQFSDRQDLVDEMVDDFGQLIERYGHVPNGTRSYYLSRSQPPVFYLMTALSADHSDIGRRRRLREMRAEHHFWMEGENTLKPGGASRRLVRLPSGDLLNRYWDDRAEPRDESWREDTELVRGAGLPPQAIYRDLRAAAESGWDFSSRWLADGKTLASIRTTRVLPVDLNSLLFGMERRIESECRALVDSNCASEYKVRADKRRTAIERYLWNNERGFYSDYDLDNHAPSAQKTAAMMFPLFVGAAGESHAQSTATALDSLIAEGGVLSTDQVTGQQWDAPNGWAPLQWVAISGLRAYRRDDAAVRIERAWLTTVKREYCASGRMLEKYNVKDHGLGGGGEYPLQDGFGWTNGVSLAVLKDLERHSAAFDDTCH